MALGAAQVPHLSVGDEVSGWYRVPIVGDGLTPETAYAPHLPAGTIWQADIPTDASGKPTAASCVVSVLSDNDAEVIAFDAAIEAVDAP